MRAMKRNLKEFSIAVIVLAGAVGCQRDASLNNQFGGFNELNSDAFAVVDYSDVEANIQDATLDKSMTMNPVFRGGRFQGRGGPMGHKGRRGNHLGGILRNLNIDEDQRASIKELISGHRESVKEAFTGLRDANQSIIDQARAERQTVIDAVRNGDITREEARDQLRTLSQAKRDAIASNPDSAPFIETICAAKLTLFDAVRALLDANQQVGWDEWVASHDGQCFAGSGGSQG